MKPCPFCGCYSMSLRNEPSTLARGEKTDFFLLCKECEAHGPVADNGVEAYALWDKRATSVEKL